VKKTLDKLIVSSLFVNSILIAIILSHSSHKFMSTLIVGLLVTIGLKVTKRMWDD